MTMTTQPKIFGLATLFDTWQAGPIEIKSVRGCRLCTLTTTTTDGVVTDRTKTIRTAARKIPVCSTCLDFLPLE
jgi:hypothetical protein